MDYRNAGSWDTGSEMALMEAKGTDFRAQLSSLTLADVVYFLLQERNCRIFQQPALCVAQNIGDREKQPGFESL